jgi:hypothetical protein
MGLQMRQSFAKTPLQLANGQRVTSAKVCGISLTVAHHDFLRTLQVFLDLRDAIIVYRCLSLFIMVGW